MAATAWERRIDLFVPPTPQDDGPVDDVVVGAGVIGLAAACELARLGRRVVVLEAQDAIGLGTSGRSTGKLSLLQGTRLTEIERVHGTAGTRRYVEECRTALVRVERLLDDWDVLSQRGQAATWAFDESQLSAAHDEHVAATRAGLDTRWQNEVPGGLPGLGAAVLDGQLQVDPLDYTVAWAREASSLGVQIHVGQRVDDVRAAVGGVRVRSVAGLEVDAREAIVATGLPALDRSGAFAALVPQRSYAVAFETSTPFEPMALTAGTPSFSVRGVAATPEQPELVVVGGQGHPVGRQHPAGRHVEALRSWAHEHLDVGDEVAVWSAQDYMPPDQLPVAGRVPGGLPVHAVTGFAKWGLVAGVAAAQRLAAAVVADEGVPRVPPLRWAKPRSLASIGEHNATVGAHMVSGWVGAASRSDDEPGEGQGVVTRGLPPVATSTTRGRSCAVSAVCTHLGGIVRWNDVEQSWDCPLHGSRFAADGTVLEGPATKDLTPVDEGETR